MIERIPTNSGRNTTGKPILGLEVEQLIPSGVGLIAGIALIGGAQMVSGTIPQNVLVLTISMVAGPLAWALIFVRGKPPNFQRDFFRTYFLGMGSWWKSPRDLSGSLIQRKPSPLVRATVRAYLNSNRQVD